MSQPPRRVRPGRTPRPNTSGAVNQGSEYTAEEVAFQRGIERYKRTRQRPFPTWSEVLKVVHALGYRKVEPEGPLPDF